MLQPTTDHHKNMWCPVVPCGQFLDDFIDDFGFAVARIHLFSGYLFTLKQRGNSVLAIIGAHPPKLLDQVAMLDAFFPGLFDISKHLFNICFSE